MTDHSDQNRSLAEAIECLPLHAHLCLLYETREEHFAAIVPFIRCGLARGDQCVYIVDESTAADVLEILRESGIDVDSALSKGALVIITKKESYLREGSFDPEGMIILLRDTVDAAKADGFPVVSAAGEMTWALGDEPGVGRLIEYESKLNYLLPTCDMVAICQYNLRKFPPKIIEDVIYTHPLVIVGGEIYENFYYMPPDAFLASDREGSKVKYLVSNLKSRTQDQSSLERANVDLQLSAEQMSKYNRVLRILSGVNQILVRATDEMELLREACQIIVDVGGYLMSWIGFSENDEEKTVRPICATGHVEGYLDAIRITWSDTELGHGPTGTAIRTGEPAFTRDILTDPLFAPWRDEAMKRNYASSIAIPLITDAKTLGAINLFSDKPNAFETEEVQLLTELADDVTYGVMALRTRKELRLMEENMRDFYRRTILAATDGKLMICEPGEILDIAGESVASLEITCEHDMSKVRGMVRDVAVSAGMDESRIYDLVLCAGEATTNAFKHAGKGIASIHKVTDGIFFVVSDKGSGITAKNLPEVALRKGYTTAISLGLGYKAMITTADQVYLSTGPEGTIVGIEMKLHPVEMPPLLAGIRDTW